jgi:hypothetical protein
VEQLVLQILHVIYITHAYKYVSTLWVFPFKICPVCILVSLRSSFFFAPSPPAIPE